MRGHLLQGGNSKVEDLAEGSSSTHGTRKQREKGGVLHIPAPSDHIQAGPISKQETLGDILISALTPSDRNVEHQFPGQAAAPVPAYPALSPLQMLWWQQVYAHQYYLQYQAAVSAQATLGAGAALPPSAQPLNLARAPGEEPAPAPNLDNQAANENVPVNAQGGPALNEDDFNRDWLDWVYTFSRAAILLSIVYFYSSFSRFVMVMGAMLLVYLHQAGWFPFRQEGQQRAPNNNIEINHDGQHANNVELEEMERIMDDGLEDESGEDTGEDTSTAQRPGLMASAWSFVTTFFTSLIPEGPPPVAN